MPKGKTVGTPTKKKPAPYMSKTEKGTVGMPMKGKMPKGMPKHKMVKGAMKAVKVKKARGLGGKRQKESY